jgi:predicted nucleic acid-binding protein
LKTEAEISHVYWDTSAVLSVLVEDSHSKQAVRWARRGGLHIISTLAFAEVSAVLDRMEREGQLTSVLVGSAREALADGPWRFMRAAPARTVIEALATKYALRGADLWHLSLAKTLLKDLPELKVLTFDSRMHAGAEKEGILCR